MNKIKYLWKFYIKPIVTGISSNSEEGLRLRIEKLVEDKRKRK